MEASDYLERLDALVSPPTMPDATDFVRLTRALRGSALMARQSTIAAAAAAFEKFARHVKARGVWDESTRQRAVSAVDDFKVLVRKVGHWTDAEERRAGALISDLTPEAAQTEMRSAGELPSEPDAGARAFVGREGAAVASALDQAAKSLQQNPRAHDPVHRVLVVAQPLRGLSVLSDLPPLQDLLEGVERAVTEIVARPEPIAEAPMLLDAAAKAVARVARELASDGNADSEGAEVRRFVALLSQIFEGALVPVETLFHDDDGPHILHRGTTPGRRRVLGHVELVSHGEHLVQAAHDLEQASSRTQVELRAQSLTPTFRALAAASGSPVLDAVSAFALAARDAVARRAAVECRSDFVAHLCEAGRVLVEAATGDEEALGRKLRDNTAALRSLAVPVARPAAPAVPASPPQRATQPTVAEVAAPAATAEDTPDLAGSWARYERLMTTHGLGPTPSLDEFLRSAAPDAPGREAVAAPAATVAAPRAARPEPESEPVAIRSLCYSGRAALSRAASLRAEITTQLAAGVTSDDLRDLIEEVLDLVDLGLQE